MDKPTVEYNPLLVGAPVPIFLPAAQWIEVHEFFRYAKVPGHYSHADSPGVYALKGAIIEALVTVASLKAHEAQGAESQEAIREAMNPFPQIFQAMREAGFPPLPPIEGEPE